MDQNNFLTQAEGPRFIGLAGRTWRVLHVDWNSRKAHVEPDGTGGKTRWMGGSPGFSYELAQSIQQVAADEARPNHLSQRAVAALKELRDNFAWVRAGHTHLLPAKETGRTDWWTFGGQQVNDTLADLLRHHCEIESEPDSLTVHLRVDLLRARECIEKLRLLPESGIAIHLDPEAESAFKFAELLPNNLRAKLINTRMIDVAGTLRVLERPLIATFGKT